MAASVKIVDRTDAFLKALQRQEVEFVTKGGLVAQAEMRSRAPKKSGNLINSIQTVQSVEEGHAVSETGPTADYAVYVERGTGVYAVNGDGRKTPWTYQAPDGKWYTTVGAKAQPFAEPGWQAALRRFGDIALKILGRKLI